MQTTTSCTCSIYSEARMNTIADEEIRYNVLRERNQNSQQIISHPRNQRDSTASSYLAPLKYDRDSPSVDIIEYGDEIDYDMDECDIDVSVSSKITESKAPKILRFKPMVEIVEIPNRLSYTPKQRLRMWNSKKEIRATVKRNRIEYEWEGWDWNKVVEEEQLCDLNGGKVHPAHATEHAAPIQT